MQIVNVQQLMRMELRPPSISALRDVGRWYLEGLRTCLPASISQWGWRAQSLLIELDRHGKIERRNIVEHSRFGARRLVPDNNAQDFPLMVALPAASIYRTQISLPPEGANTIAKNGRAASRRTLPHPAGRR